MIYIFNRLPPCPTQHYCIPPLRFSQVWLRRRPRRNARKLATGRRSFWCFLRSMKEMSLEVSRRVAAGAMLGFSQGSSRRQTCAVGRLQGSPWSKTHRKSRAAWLTPRKYSSGKLKSRRQMLRQVSSTLSSRNGDAPLSMTYASTPRLQRSEVRAAGSPNTSSGDENSGLPSRGWMWGMLERCAASPKSVSLTRGWVDVCSNNTFSGWKT